MQAILFDRAGAPDQVVRVAEVKPPRAAPGEALVQVMARPIQPADLAFIRGQYRVRPHLPQTAGLEGVGVVLQPAEGSEVAPGQRVAFRWPGSWAEVAAVPAERLIPVPDDVSDADACQMALNPTTAFALLQEAQVEPGGWLLLTAAASTVANLVGTLARRRGVHVLGVVRGDADASQSRCTADLVYSSDAADLPDLILAAPGFRQAAALLDSVGGPLVASLFPTLASGARIVAYGVQSRGLAAVNNAQLIYGNLTWMGFGIDRWLGQQSSQSIQDMYTSLWALTRAGELALPVTSIFPLKAIGAALAVDGSPGRRGKVLLISPPIRA